MTFESFPENYCYFIEFERPTDTEIDCREFPLNTFQDSNKVIKNMLSIKY